MGVEREPVTHMTDEQEKLQGDQTQLQSIQSLLSQVALSASEFSLPSAFESTQSVTSSNSAVVGAAASVGAVVGGHEVEVTQLATSAQRGFTYTTPASETKVARPPRNSPTRSTRARARRYLLRCLKAARLSCLTARPVAARNSSK
jgi:flagellar capping protein FliD